jgi:hypothetical protein
MFSVHSWLGMVAEQIFYDTVCPLLGCGCVVMQRDWRNTWCKHWLSVVPMQVIPMKYG